MVPAVDVAQVFGTSESEQGGGDLGPGVVAILSKWGLKGGQGI